MKFFNVHMRSNASNIRYKISPTTSRKLEPPVRYSRWIRGRRVDREIDSRLSDCAEDVLDSTW